MELSQGMMVLMQQFYGGHMEKMKEYEVMPPELKDH